MFCNNCGKQINNSGICPYCGFIYEESAVAGKTISIHDEERYANNGVNGGFGGQQSGTGYAGMGNYGKQNNQSQLYEKYNNFNQYGNYQNNQHRVRQGSANKEKSDSTLIALIVAACVVFVVLVGVAVFFAFDTMEKGGTVEPTTEAEAVPATTPTPTPTPAVKPASSYICVPGGGSWYDGSAAALRYGENAHLVTFDSLEEFHFVNSLAAQNGIEYYWAGMKVYDYEQWISGGIDSAGNVFNPNNVVWLTGEPSKYDYNLEFEDRVFEDSLVIIFKDGRWVANDAPGTTVYTSESAGYIIEIE